MLVRHAEPLQQTTDAKDQQNAKVNKSLAKSLNLKSDDLITLIDINGNTAQVGLTVDDTIADNTVLVYQALNTTSNLDLSSGTIRIEANG